MLQRAILCMNCLLFISLLFLQTGCKKQLKAPEPAPLETGELTASSQTIVINAAEPGSEAVTFSWNAMTNSLIEYSLILIHGEFSDTVSIAKNTVSKKMTNAELNNIVVSKLNMDIDVAGEIQCRLFAAVTINDKTASSNVLTLTVTPAPTGPTYARLWIVGDATPNGWDINNPNEMTTDPTNNFQFKYGAVLNAGEFKIPVTTGDWGTDFFMPPVNHPDLASTDVQLTPGGQPDHKWQILNPGPYKILLNISSSPFIRIEPFTPYTALWMVGDATPAGWNINSPTPMTPTPGNPYEFTFSGAMNAGQFKIPVTTGNWGADYFMPAVDGTGPGSSPAVFIPGGNPDYKWQLTEAGNYRITINQLTETISIVKQ